MTSVVWIILLSSCNKQAEKKQDIDIPHDDNQEAFSISGTIDGHDYTDLGLSVKWATCNLGAQTPWEKGNYYAWGETIPYTEWTQTNYNYDYAICDYNYVLDAQFDAVTVNWGRSWRMPTKEEINELIHINNCEWIWIDNINGTEISGYQVKSKKNGNSIFLPAGHKDNFAADKVSGNYWSSATTVLIFTNPYDHVSFTIYFINGLHHEGSAKCSAGLNIRGVVGNPNSFFPDPQDYTVDIDETAKQGFTVSGELGGYSYVDLGFPSRTLWATQNIGASVPHEYGEYYAWGETTPKELYDQDTYKFYIGNSESGPYHWAQYSKYVWYDQHGTPDYKLTLDPEDDAATVNWGAQWQMPSKEQYEELAYYCRWYRKDITVKGERICGFEGESKINGYKIYIPFADMKYKQRSLDYLSAWYWSRDLTGSPNTSADMTDYDAWYMTIQPQKNLMVVIESARYHGFPVRPVVKN